MRALFLRVNLVARGSAVCGTERIAIGDEEEFAE